MFNSIISNCFTRNVIEFLFYNIWKHLILYLNDLIQVTKISFE